MGPSPARHASRCTNFPKGLRWTLPIAQVGGVKHIRAIGYSQDAGIGVNDLNDPEAWKLVVNEGELRDTTRQSTVVPIFACLKKLCGQCRQ
jgi:hypothetical protein